MQEFITTRQGYRLATSTGGVLTGRGADIFLIDDPVKPGEERSDVQRQGADEWFDHTLYPGLPLQIDMLAHCSSGAEADEIVAVPGRILHAFGVVRWIPQRRIGPLQWLKFQITSAPQSLSIWVHQGPSCRGSASSITRTGRMGATCSTGHAERRCRAGPGKSGRAQSTARGALLRSLVQSSLSSGTFKHTHRREVDESKPTNAGMRH